ncbi:hypothetical protein Hanom_Chr03g00184841 [Helianthus anomalus]
MSEENQALQRQLLVLQKQAKELEISQSKEQIEAKLHSKYEATMRRERPWLIRFLISPNNVGFL